MDNYATKLSTRILHSTQVPGIGFTLKQPPLISQRNTYSDGYMSHNHLYIDGLAQERGNSITSALGAVSIRKTVLPGMAIPMLKIRRPNGRLIFNMEIAIRR